MPQLSGNEPILGLNRAPSTNMVIYIRNPSTIIFNPSSSSLLGSSSSGSVVTSIII
jgi:hypothetical protein